MGFSLWSSLATVLIHQLNWWQNPVLFGSPWENGCDYFKLLPMLLLRMESDINLLWNIAFQSAGWLPTCDRNLFMVIIGRLVRLGHYLFRRPVFDPSMCKHTLRTTRQLQVTDNSLTSEPTSLLKEISCFECDSNLSGVKPSDSTMHVLSTMLQ